MLEMAHTHTHITYVYSFEPIQFYFDFFNFKNDQSFDKSHTTSDRSRADLGMSRRCPMRAVHTHLKSLLGVFLCRGSAKRRAHSFDALPRAKKPGAGEPCFCRCMPCSPGDPNFSCTTY